MSNSPSRLPIWATIALRELRGGLGGFKIFIACLVIGVTTIASVGTLTHSITDSLASEGQVILGGDIEVSSRRQPLSVEAIDYIKSQGTMVTTSRMPTMMRAVTQGKSTMVDLRSVGEAYPLYGTVETSPQMPMADILAQKNGVYGAAIEDLLADRLGLSIGDTMRLNDLEVELRALVTGEPDKANLGFQLGPTVYLADQALAATGLVQYGSLIEYDYKIILPKNELSDLKKFRRDFKKAFDEDGWRVRDRSNAAPGLRRFIERMSLFLTLVGLTSLVVGGVGVGNAVKSYMDFKTKTIATLKILGATGGTIFKVYFAQVIIIGLIAIAIGLTLGSYLPQFLVTFLPDNFPVNPNVSVYIQPLILAAVYGLLVTTAFTAWPLGKARDLPPVRLFRDQVDADNRRPRAATFILIILSILTIIALAVGLSDNRMIAAGFVVAAAATLLILRFTGWFIQMMAARMPRTRRPLLRLAIANIHRPGAATGPVTISMGLGLTLFTTLALIEGNLDAQVQDTVPERAPSFFFMDIQKHQMDDLSTKVRAIDGVTDLQTVSNLRGTVIKLNGVEADPKKVDPSVRWVLRGDRGVTYKKELPEGSELVEGSWWPEGYDGPPQVSIGEEQAKGLGLELGDTVTLNILGANITAEIRSVRRINWGTMGFNFVFMFDPYTLSQAPHTMMATVKTDSAAAEKAAYKLVTDTYANVSVVRMKEILQKVNDLLNQISIAIKGTAAIAILSGIFVLAGAIAAGFRQRVYESVIMKVVGAVRRQILTAYIIEYLLVGLIVAVIALGLGGLASWFVVAKQFDMTFTFLPVPVTITLITSLLATLGFGLISSFRALAVRPNTILRGE